MFRHAFQAHLPLGRGQGGSIEVFVIGGSPFVLGNFTPAIKTGKHASRIDSIGSTISDLFNGSIPYVAKINPLTMQMSQQDLTEGSTVNDTGGLLMHNNGYQLHGKHHEIYIGNPLRAQPEKLKTVLRHSISVK